MKLSEKQNKMDEQRLDTKQAAEYLGLSPETLATWRCTKRQEIPYLKLGSRVKYLKSDLDAWLESRKVGSNQN